MSMLATLAMVGPIWLVGVAIPGPNFLTVSRLAVLRGRPAAMAAVGGIGLGTACWGLAGLFGVQALFLAAPMLYGVLQIIGAGWLILVGMRTIRGSFQPARPHRPASGTAWWVGLATSLSNPKSTLMVGSLFTAVMAPGTPIAFGLAAVAEMVLISVTFYGLLGLLASTRAVAAGFGRAERWIDRVAGGIFIAFGLHIVISRA